MSENTEKIKLKYSYEKEFVKAFKDKCKKKHMTQTDVIRDSIIDYIAKNTDKIKD